MFKKELKQRLGLLIIAALMAQITVIPSMPAFADESDNVVTITDSTDVDEEVVEEVEDLVEDVETDTVAETIEEIVDTVEEEAESEVDVSEDEVEAVVEDAIDEVVEEIMEDIEDMDEEEATEAIEEIAEDIEEAIEEVTAEIAKNPGKRARLLRKIQHLKKVLAKLRAKTIAHHKGVGDRLQQEGKKHHPAVFEVRWGVLNGEHETCDATEEEIQEALDADEKPCKGDSVSYTGTISVDNGTLKIRKEHLFEENDSVSVMEGTSISFDSKIGGHWDGLIVEFFPEADAPAITDGTMPVVNVTISLGSLNETYTLGELNDRQSIGNDHELSVRKIGKVLSGLSQANQDEILEHKIKIQEKISDMREKLYRLKMLNKDDESLDDIEALIDEAGDYTFDEDSSEEIQAEIDDIVEAMDDDVSDSELKALVAKLRARLTFIKAKSKIRKFANNMIPFKDTDDSEWYTEYVAPVKERGIIGGYKDANGNDLGEFRPANNITVAEILKIALETAEEGESAGTPSLRAALAHWAKGYVKRAEELDLDIVDGDVDLNRPATRGEVVRLVLEAMGVTPDQIASTDFSDVSAGHKHAAFIQYAKDLGIISGDAGTTNFRPDAYINRAEAAKIANQIIEIFGLNS